MNIYNIEVLKESDDLNHVKIKYKNWLGFKKEESYFIVKDAYENTFDVVRSKDGYKLRSENQDEYNAVILWFKSYSI